MCFGTFAIYKQSHRHASLFSVKQSIFVSVSPEMLKAPQDPPPMLANMTNRSQSATHLPKNLFKQNTNHLFGTVPLSAGSIRSAETRLIKKKRQAPLQVTASTFTSRNFLKEKRILSVDDAERRTGQTETQ